MYGPSAGTKKVAVVERWPLVEVRLYIDIFETINGLIKQDREDHFSST